MDALRLRVPVSGRLESGRVFRDPLAARILGEDPAGVNSARVRARSPRGTHAVRAAREEDIAHAVAFLASDEAVRAEIPCLRSSLGSDSLVTAAPASQARRW
jgi:NAD(P)-dependent dehydrogenase (short-subunit alcohol dehydrogenase family)